MVYVIMGVSGSGKTTVGQLVAQELKIPFFDGDDFHPEANKRKMSAGIALDDDDRFPWLAALARKIGECNSAGNAVLACSALKQKYRDILSAGGPVTYVYLVGPREVLLKRLTTRSGHFFSPGLLDSQLSALEEPSDAIRIPIDSTPLQMCDTIIRHITLIRTHPGGVFPLRQQTLLSTGSPQTSLSPQQLRDGLRAALEKLGTRKKVLIIPPDITRFTSRAGELTRYACEFFGTSVSAILPALGSHQPMHGDEIRRMFGAIPQSLIVNHSWRDDLELLGEIPGGFVSSVSEGLIAEPWPVEVNRLLTDKSLDCILSIGQVVPHEVAGMANHSKNILVGCGGKRSIDATHFLGAVYGMERIMGKAVNPVRALFSEAQRRFLDDVPIIYVLTVIDGSGKHVRGLYVGSGQQCFEDASQLSAQVNITHLSQPLKKCVVYLPRGEYHSTWLGNKAIYRTRMAMAHGGELIVVAPDIERFGEDPAADALIRKYGYRSRDQILAWVKEGNELADSLSVAAHLIHGSSEGRFSITYATTKMTKEEIESVGFKWADPESIIARYGSDRHTGFYQTVDGDDFFAVSNPGLGLWTASE